VVLEVGPPAPAPTRTFGSIRSCLHQKCARVTVRAELHRGRKRSPRPRFRGWAQLVRLRARGVICARHLRAVDCRAVDCRAVDCRAVDCIDDLSTAAVRAVPRELGLALAKQHAVPTGLHRGRRGPYPRLRGCACSARRRPRRCLRGRPQWSARRAGWRKVRASNSRSASSFQRQFSCT
jgi:hypothetical protein